MLGWEEESGDRGDANESKQPLVSLNAEPPCPGIFRPQGHSSGEGVGPMGREQARYFVAGLPIQAGGGHVAGPIRTAAGQEDQVTGEGLVLLDHDDVPDLQDRRQTAL